METPGIVIDEEFRGLLPVLPAETLSQLEESLLEHGCVHPLTLWGNILIDGHNRYEIATKHSIPFTVVTKEFTSRSDVTIWIITTQVARRNLNARQLSYYRGLHYKTEKRSNGDASRFAQQHPVYQNDKLQESTSKRLAEYYKVSAPTIIRDEKFADAVIAIGETSAEAKRSILAGEAGITKKHLRELFTGADGSIADAARQIEDGTFEKPKPSSTKLPGADPDPAAPDTDVRPVVASIIEAAEGFLLNLRGLPYDIDKETIEMRLRSHIDSLEGIIEQMQNGSMEAA